MPSQVPFPLLLKFVLWIGTLVVATILLRRRRVTRRLRLVFLVGGVLLFGWLFGILIPGDVNPNPVTSLRTLLASGLLRQQWVPLLAGMVIVLMATVLLSNKSICGWGCQLGLLQDLLHRVPWPKWKPPFWMSNGVRIVAAAALIGGLVIGGLDWIGIMDPFRLFSLNLSLWGGLFSALLITASLFVYRPWCQFLCPFGLASWVVEQVSLFRPRINRKACIECQRCVKACPSQAMHTFFEEKKWHADCFACGACIEACPKDQALGWRRRAEQGSGR